MNSSVLRCSVWITEFVWLDTEACHLIQYRALPITLALYLPFTVRGGVTVERMPGFCYCMCTKFFKNSRKPCYFGILPCNGQLQWQWQVLIRLHSCSIVREYRSAISIHRFLHRCHTNLHEKFQHRKFHTTIEKVFTKACALPYFFYSLLAYCKCTHCQLLW